jgi:hypothetical protein
MWFPKKRAEQAGGWQLRRTLKIRMMSLCIEGLGSYILEEAAARV